MEQWRNGEKLDGAARRQLREEARAAFDGKPLLDGRFGFEITCFKAAIERETGNLLHLPIAGGAFEQPPKAMEIMIILQEVWRKEKKVAKQ
jgi:hypothetical protein